MVVACFASNVARVQSISEQPTYQIVASDFGAVARYYGSVGEECWRLRTEGADHRAEHLGSLPEEEVLAVATGTRGEIGAALHRLMMDTHPHVTG